VVLNWGPPFFLVPYFPTLTAKETFESSYILPRALDPDKDSFSISLSGAPTFVSVSDMIVTIFPALGDAGTFEMDVLLTDEKGEYSSYPLSIIVSKKHIIDNDSEKDEELNWDEISESVSF